MDYRKARSGEACNKRYYLDLKYQLATALNLRNRRTIMLNKRIAVLFLYLFIFVTVGTVCAEETLGVPVYPGATRDIAISKYLQLSGLDGAAYRSNDSIAKVIKFYKGQKGFKEIGILKDWAQFSKDNKISIMIQSPWEDAVTKEHGTDTLISISYMYPKGESGKFQRKR